MGEEALRRIVASSTNDIIKMNNLEGKRRSKEETIESMWEKTVQGVARSGSKRRPKRPLPNELDVLMGHFNGNSRDRSTTPGDEVEIAIGESRRPAGLGTEPVPVKIESGPVVNAERRYWRKSRQDGAQKPTKEKVVVEAQDAMIIDS